MGEEAEGGGAGSLGKTGASGQTVCESSGREPASGLSGNYSIEGSVKKDEIDDIWKEGPPPLSGCSVNCLLQKAMRSKKRSFRGSRLTSLVSNTVDPILSLLEPNQRVLTLL